MERALAGYQAASSYAVAEVTTAATYEMGELYRRLATDLMKSERPADLDAEELEQYDLLLEEQAFPFEEKSVEIHELNARRAAEGLYDSWVRKSYAVLADIEPARFGKQVEAESFVTVLELPMPAAPPPAPVAEAPKKGRKDEKAAPTVPAPVPTIAPAVAEQFSQAVRLLESGDYAAARPILEKLVASEQTLAAPAVNLGMLHARESRLPDAEAALAEGIRRDPQSAVAFNELAAVQREAGRFTDAEVRLPPGARGGSAALPHAPEFRGAARPLPLAAGRGVGALRGLSLEIGHCGPAGLRLDRGTQAPRRRRRADRRSATMRLASHFLAALVFLAPLARAQEAEQAPPVAPPAEEPAVAADDTAPPTMDHLELDPTSITGNRELPKVMVIVPWKRAELGDLEGRPANSLLNEVLEPVDREVFRRELRYFEALEAKPET